MILSNITDDDVQQYLYGANTRGYDSDDDYSTEEIGGPVMCCARTLSESALLANWSPDEEQCFPIYDGKDRPVITLSRVTPRCFPHAIALNKTDKGTYYNIETASNLVKSSHDSILSTMTRLTPSMVMGIKPVPVYMGLYEQAYTPQTPDYSAAASLITKQNSHVMESRKPVNQSDVSIPLLPPLPRHIKSKSSSSFDRLFFKDADGKSNSTSSLPSLYNTSDIESPATDTESSPPPVLFDNNISIHRKPIMPRYDSGTAILERDCLEQRPEDWFQHYSTTNLYTWLPHDGMNRYHTCRHDRRDVKEMWQNFGVDIVADDPCCGKKQQRKKRYNTSVVNTVRRATYETVVSLQEFERERDNEAALLEAELRGRFHARQWGDDVDDINDQTPRSFANADGTKTVIDYRRNDDGQKVKVTSTVRTTAVKIHVNPAIARRRTLKKFGDCKGLKAGPDTDSTSFGEKVTLKLSANAKATDLDAPNDDDAKKKAALSNTKISCRICKGDHFTAKCPFKDTHQPIVSTTDSFREETAAGITRDSGTGKYVPPGMRGNARDGVRDGARMGGRDGDRDDLPTVRISNLSEDVTEQDLRDLIHRFGPTARVFVAWDKDLDKCKGFGYVTFYEKMDADRCIKALNGYGYDNLILAAEIAKNKPRT
ncbi:translation initiation factor eIF3 subunit g [Physocladia obscura]|uniref:Eukaryotic translation initiation factor 3 subunit G n=1 Tax=Physocladia obscura TaxID=109957 RepID=A0AAD5XJD4_9FUNG|nr:translation initiation factor eIF3 subunit g [Physocladia obscura]